jgi:hypothetical protein
MTNNTAHLATLGIAIAIAISPCHAQTYQWKDSSGRTVISDSPPPGGVKSTAKTFGGVPIASSAEKTAEKTAEAPKTVAERDMDFKKRQQEAREKTEKTEKEAKAARDRQENCELARRNLAALESGRQMATLDANGNPLMMDANERSAEVERSRAVIGETCR